MTFRGETNSPLEGIATFHLLNDNISMMRKETKKKTGGKMKTQIRPIAQGNIVGTSYAGVIRCEASVLEENLGTPNLNPSSDAKTTCEWDTSYRTDDGEWLIFTVYNYKDNTPPEENEMWHVGSDHKNDNELFEFLERILRCDVITRGRKQ